MVAGFRAVSSRWFIRRKEQSVYARIATFEGDPANVDQTIEMVRGEVEGGGDMPSGLEGAKMMMLVDRASGKGMSVTLYDSEEAMRKGDEALNAMNPPAASGRRTGVEFYEVPVQTVSKEF
jgi:hypothetical protein